MKYLKHIDFWKYHNEKMSKFLLLHNDLERFITRVVIIYYHIVCCVVSQHGHHAMLTNNIIPEITTFSRPKG